MALNIVLYLTAPKKVQQPYALINVRFVAKSKCEPKIGDMRTAMPSELVLASKSMDVMLKSMESSIVMTLPVDIANPLRLLGNRLIPKNGIYWVNLQEKLNDIQLSLLHI